MHNKLKIYTFLLAFFLFQIVFFANGEEIYLPLNDHEVSSLKYHQDEMFRRQVNLERGNQIHELTKYNSIYNNAP